MKRLTTASALTLALLFSAPAFAEDPVYIGRHKSNADDANAIMQLTKDVRAAVINKNAKQLSTLMFRSDNDRVVPLQQAAELIDGLRSHNIDHDVIMIPNEIHDMARYSSWLRLFNAADVYFDRQLNKPSATSP